MKFTKMHGAGNDYVYLDCFAQASPQNPKELAVKMADRRFGIGGDGLILIEPSEIADARMRMFNADGSEAEMCGNGIRCVAKYVFDHGIARKTELNIETGNGVLQLQLEIEAGLAKLITVDMGKPGIAPADIPTSLSQEPVVGLPVSFSGIELKATCVSMGNPHCIIFVPEATDDLVLGLGPKIEHDPRFPQRTNVEFVEIITDREFRQRTWERGSGETWACGTGASAVCVAGVLTGVGQREIVIHLRGGDLHLRWEESSDHVFMTGGAVEVFHGVWPD
ncbi:MAG: diaminopimelate epimerase [bacterium]|nr:diaminopimelate epimerase [bacterium]